MLDRIIVISVAFILDLILGDPQNLWHPVMGIGKLIEYSEKILRKLFKTNPGREEDKRKKLMAGTIMVLAVVSLSVAICRLVLFIAGCFGRIVRIAVESVLCYQLLAMKSLKKESMKVYNALCSGDIEVSRYAVSMIVGRDTESLDDKGITRAAVETVAENTSDGVTAPLIYMMLFGACGGYFYKAVNTMDSMVGYKNDKYIYFGRAAARLDDILNFIPSRITAVLMILAAFLIPGMDGRNAGRIYKRDRLKHASPNSAQTEAVCAGALNIQLAGNAYYFGKLYEKPTIGNPVREIKYEDIIGVNKLMSMVSLLTLIIGILGIFSMFFVVRI